MKRTGIIFFLLSAFTAPCATFAQDPSFPKTVSVFGRELSLRENTGNPGQGFLAEYIPQGETFDNWTLMFASRFVPMTNADAETAAKRTAQNIAGKKKAGDPVANSMILSSNTDKSVAVDFVVSAGKLEVIEHNIFRFVAVPRGLISLQLARRIYSSKSSGDEMRTFLKDIPKLRSKILDELQRADIPVSKFAR